MNDSTAKTSSSLAITEKRAQPRPGGCVGIFFQLFDWNRRIAKKKLFSKKLLPPARAKQASKKFGGNEKLSTAKLHLIADENRGGFPNVKKNNGFVDMEQKHEMQAPSLVARLMGLESMPAARRDKPKKALGTENFVHKEDKFVSNCNGSDKEDVCLEKGQVKHELRPQKLQKTGQFDRRAVTRFGAEALQFKNVFSCSKKNHDPHPKLASPVKSPRVGRNTSRLIDAAAKILEPGLQATNKAKCALTYSNAMKYPPKDEVMIERKTVLSPELSRQTGYCDNSTNSVVGQSSCKSCGNPLDVNLRLNLDEHPTVVSASVSNHVSASSQGPAMSQPTALSSLENKRNADFSRSQDQAVSFAARAKDNVRIRSQSFRDEKSNSRFGQERWHLSSQQRKSPMDEQAPTALKDTTRTPNQMSLDRERVPRRSKLSNLQSRKVPSAINGASGAKDFVAVNRSVSGRSRSRIPTRLDNSKLEAERKYFSRQDDLFSQERTPVRKRRTLNVNRQVDGTKFVPQSFAKQGNPLRDRTVNGIGDYCGSTDQTCTRSKLVHQVGGNNASISKSADVISFTFNSPIKQETIILPPRKMVKKRQDGYDFVRNSNSERRKLMLDENDRKTSFQEPLSLNGDALGALLEEKLKELACQEEDELAMKGNSPRRTTAMILQELISALTAEQPISQNDEATGVSSYSVQDSHNHLFSHGHMFNRDTAFQAKAKTPGTSVGYLHDIDHFSPGSVLEASFSTDSCISSSLDDSSGHKMRVQQIMDYSYDLPQPSEYDGELLDSATSFNKGRTGSEMVTDIINYVSKILHNINYSGIELTGSRLDNAKEVILNAELLFGIAISCNSRGIEEFSVGPFLLNELETLAAAMWTNSNCLLPFEEAKEGNLIREFLFDCVIEYLDSKYAKYCKSGFKTFTRLPPCMNTVMLIQDIVEEVRGWTDMAGRMLDEIIDWEMSNSLGKWIDFDIEAFETGADIDGDILQILVEEVVTDLFECRLGSL